MGTDSVTFSVGSTPLGSTGHGHAAGKRDVVKDHVRARVASGELRCGSRVPSILSLARALRVAKNTVIAALDDLVGEGVLEVRPRLGFFVLRAPRRERASTMRLADLAVDHVAHGMAAILSSGHDGLLAIGSGVPAESLVATPEWSAFLRSAPARDASVALRYGDPRGEPRLREVLAARSGAEVDPDRVVATHGAVEALNLCFAAAAADKHSRRVAIESPGYFMLGPMLETLGLVPVLVPRSPTGIDLDALAAETRREPIAALMLNPSHHNPTGGTLTLAERFAIARLAEERRFWIVEDDLYKGLWHEEQEPPSIHSLVPDRTMYIGSFSKTLGPGLRVGFVVSPPALLDDLRRRRFLHSLTGDPFIETLVADFVERRGYQRHLAQMRDELGRRARGADAQAERFTSLGGFTAPYRGGLFRRFDFRPGIDAMRLYEAARARNVLLSPGAFFVHGELAGRREAWMRVNVSCCEGTTLARTLAVVGELVEVPASTKHGREARAARP